MNWEALTAISTAIVALSVIGIAIGALFLFGRIMATTRVLQNALAKLQSDTHPVLEKAKALLSDTTETANKLRSEVEAIAGTSEDVRTRILRAVDSAEDRLIDVEALLDVVQDEVEETTLDVAAALRTTRRGTRIFKTMKRALAGGGRRGRKR